MTLGKIHKAMWGRGGGQWGEPGKEVEKILTPQALTYLHTVLMPMLPQSWDCGAAMNCLPWE
eukprot:6438565-Amphidinium_carterae.1